MPNTFEKSRAEAIKLGARYCDRGDFEDEGTIWLDMGDVSWTCCEECVDGPSTYADGMSESKGEKTKSQVFVIPYARGQNHFYSDGGVYSPVTTTMNTLFNKSVDAGEFDDAGTTVAAWLDRIECDVCGESNIPWWKIW